MMQKGQNVHEIIRQAAANGYQYPALALVTLGWSKRAKVELTQLTSWYMLVLDVSNQWCFCHFAPCN